MTTAVFKNKALSDQAQAFEPIRPLNLRGGRSPIPATPEEIMVPLEYCENGDVIVRMYAPGASDVTVSSTRLAMWKFEISMKNRGNGIWETALPASLNLNGDVMLVFKVDGSEVINPYLPTEFYASRIANSIEIPTEDTPYLLLQDVPHGTVSQEIFWSDSVQDWIRCSVYTPPDYASSGKEYPVLFVQHGGGENETCWVRNGRLAYIMDNAIAEGKAVPFVVVMNNGMLLKPGQSGMNAFDGIEGIIVKDCREYIEKKYRVRRDKWGRAIAGLSLGSMQAVYIGLRNPEIFGSIGSFTYLRCRDRDNTYEGNPHLNAFKNPGQFWKDYKLLFRSLGSAEAHMNEFLEDDDFLEECGITGNEHYVRKIIPEQTHNWNCWRRAYYEFIQVVFH